MPFRGPLSTLSFSALSFIVLLLTACSEAPAPPKAPEKAPEAVTGRYAFYQMYPTARLWAPDIQALRLSSIRLAQVKDEPGKSGAWEATFVSPSKGKSRSFTYSVAEAEGNLHKGVFSGFEESYRGPNGQAVPWVVQAFRIDSDEAYQTALKKSDAYVKKNPDKPMFYLLEQTHNFPDLAWRIVWGESISSSSYSVFVDASTGAYLETAH
jgi:hypothetical protein